MILNNSIIISQIRKHILFWHEALRKHQNVISHCVLTSNLVFVGLQLIVPPLKCDASANLKQLLELKINKTVTYKKDLCQDIDIFLCSDRHNADPYFLDYVLFLDFSQQLCLSMYLVPQ